ncbi:hypothetical protein EON65_20220 [archaeon]|nr:MAG: hypothetical protein EON65_20220 [archaeon]
MDRSIESDVAAGTKGAAHAFSYARSKGLFVGASLEASTFAARPDVNRAFYGEKVSISHLLSGDYPPPRGAGVLYKAIDEVLMSPSAYVRGMGSTPEVTAVRSGSWTNPTTPQTGAYGKHQQEDYIDESVHL